LEVLELEFDDLAIFLERQLMQMLPQTLDALENTPSKNKRLKKIRKKW
jgi:hypothetical protein